MLLWVVVTVVGLVTFASVMVARRAAPRLADEDGDVVAPVLSYVAGAYAIIVGFGIVILFSQYANARSATGDEATAIGTAFEQARLFPDNRVEIQNSLWCYGRAVSEFEWPSMVEGESASEVDQAYAEIFTALSAAGEPTEGTFQPAIATNLSSQLGGISTAREVRLVTASQGSGILLAVSIGGGLVVLGLLFLVTLQARHAMQASLMAVSAMFTATLVIAIAALSTPFGGPLLVIDPTLIDNTTSYMASVVPEIAEPGCSSEAGS
jgi:hypothetical protein